MNRIIFLIVICLILGSVYQIIRSNQRADFIRACLENPLRSVEACKAAWDQN